MPSDPCVICSEQLKAPLAKLAGPLLQETALMPESPSLADPVTVTDADETVPPSDGDVMLTSGGVWSRFTVALAVTLVPLASVAVPLIT